MDADDLPEDEMIVRARKVDDSPESAFQRSRRAGDPRRAGHGGVVDAL